MASDSQAPVVAVESEGRIAGRYRLERELARGGMGVVLSALDESTGSRVAIKRMHAAMASQPRMQMLFELEYRTLATIEHPRVIRVFDYGVDAGSPYYSMELLDGQDLRDMSPLPYRDACRYLCDVASSLALLHTRRLLHRDLSPRNVRCTSDGHCKLLDFGTMCQFGVPATTAGTPPFVPPEALRGSSLDHLADIFSLGALAYYLLTRRYAYRARDLQSLPEVWRKQPERPSAIVEDIPKDLDDLVLSMLSLDPLARPSSAAEVMERLIGYLGGGGKLPAQLSAQRARPGAVQPETPDQAPPEGAGCHLALRGSRGPG
jgi:serine/threonine protein kinase